MRPSALLLVVVLAALTGLTTACKSDGSGSGAGAAPVPSAHDPNGEDLVQGAVLAATETNGGMRLNKIVYVDDLPAPLGYEFHMIAYDPKGQSWDEAARMWREKKVSVIVPHFVVRKVDFMVRDYRVLAVEPVTAEEKAAFEASRTSRFR